MVVSDVFNCKSADTASCLDHQDGRKEGCEVDVNHNFKISSTRRSFG